MKKIALIILFSFTLFFYVFAENPYEEYRIPYGNDDLTWSIEQNKIVRNPVLINVLFTNTSVISIPSYLPPFTRDFIWDEKEPRATNWNYTYIDSVSYKIPKTFSAIYWVENPNTDEFFISQITESGSTASWRGITFTFSLNFDINKHIDAEATEKRLGEFIGKIKEDAELFERCQNAVQSRSTYLHIGSGFIDKIISKNTATLEDASEYGIDKTRQICYVAVNTKTTWTFCYSYADGDEIGDFICINDASISEDLLSHSSIYPNPASDRSFISLDISESCELKITLSDILGREILDVHNGFVDSGNFTKSINTSNLSKGVYFLKISIGKDYKVEKFIVE